MSGLLGPMVAPGITPDSGQGQLATAISTFFGGGPPQFGPQAPAAAPAPDPTYDKWGHIITGQPQPQAAAPTPTVPSLNVGPGLAAPMPPQAAAGPGADFAGTQVAAATPGVITPGASGYDMWGRQAPAPAQAIPQLPGLADILAMIQAAQAKQAANAPVPPGLLSGGGSEGGGGGAEGTM
jgi:hypothetical protein